MKLLKRLFRLVLHPGQLRKQAPLLFAYLLFRVRYGFLKTPLHTSPDGPKVLIVNLTDSPYHAQTEGILSHALSAAGARPIVVTLRSCEWAQRYFHACGITEFVFLDDYLRASADPTDEGAIRAFLATRPTNDDLLALEYDGINIGAKALSVVLRHVRAGSVDLSNPTIEHDALQTLVQSREAVRAARKLVQEIAPYQLIFTETGYTPHGELFAAALEKHIHCVQYVHSQRLDAITFKRYTTTENMIDPISLSPVTWKQLLEKRWAPEEEEAFMRELEGHYRDQSWFNFTLSLNKKNVSPADVRELLHVDPTKKTAVIFSHVVWDASFYYGTNLFRDYDHWLVETVKVACANPNVNWVIKLHPDYMWQTKFMHANSEMRDMIAVLANVGELPPHITVVPPDSDISTYSFFAVADYCLTVRGTIGLECPCFGIPVFTAGGGRYSNLGFTEESGSADEYLEKIRHIEDTPRLSPERITLARKHAYGLFCLRPIPFTSFKLFPVHDGDHVVDHRLHIRAGSLKDIENDPGLRTCAEWILHSRDEDCIVQQG